MPLPIELQSDNNCSMKIAILSNHSNDPARVALIDKFGSHKLEDADVVVCLGGDGFMLETLHKTRRYQVPVYGMNRGTVGFLMNDFDGDRLLKRIQDAEKAAISPLMMKAETVEGEVIEHLAINEVSLLRTGSQAARLRVLVNGKVRIEELVCDGAMVATPAGSTAYNNSAHGPIIPIDGNILAVTAVAAYRPRRWRGALIPMSAKVRFEVLNSQKRPVHASADSRRTKDVLAVDISVDHSQKMELLFDPGHGLEERILQEQFQ